MKEKVFLKITSRHLHSFKPQKVNWAIFKNIFLNQAETVCQYGEFQMLDQDKSIELVLCVFRMVNCEHQQRTR